jgi:hypothetical protein
MACPNCAAITARPGNACEVTSIDDEVVSPLVLKTRANAEGEIGFGDSSDEAKEHAKEEEQHPPLESFEDSSTQGQKVGTSWSGEFNAFMIDPLENWTTFFYNPTKSRA